MDSDYDRSGHSRKNQSMPERTRLKVLWSHQQVGGDVRLEGALDDFRLLLHQLAFACCLRRQNRLLICETIREYSSICDRTY